MADWIWAHHLYDHSVTEPSISRTLRSGWFRYMKWTCLRSTWLKWSEGSGWSQRPHPRLLLGNHWKENPCPPPGHGGQAWPTTLPPARAARTDSSTRPRWSHCWGTISPKHARSFQKHLLSFFTLFWPRKEFNVKIGEWHGYCTIMWIYWTLLSCTHIKVVNFMLHGILLQLKSF